MQCMAEYLGGGVCNGPRGKNGVEAKQLIQQDKQADGEGGDRNLAPGSERGNQGALGKLRSQVLEGCIDKVVWEKEVLDESDASGD